MPVQISEGNFQCQIFIIFFNFLLLQMKIMWPLMTALRVSHKTESETKPFSMVKKNSSSLVPICFFKR